MGKHKKMGGIWFTASRGTSFKKTPSDFNYCVAEELKDKTYANRTAVKKAFTKAAKKCSTTAPVKKAPAKK